MELPDQKGRLHLQEAPTVALDLKATFQRHFIAAQRSHQHQNFRLELADLPTSDIRRILRQIVRWSAGQAPGNSYESYGDIYPGLARWRIGDFRLYTHHLGGNVYVMLHVYKKLGQELPQDVKEKIIRRARIYENQQRALDLQKYAAVIRTAQLL